MFSRLKAQQGVVTIGFVLGLGSSLAVAAEPLPSWRSGETRDAIVAFVAAVTTEGSPGFVAPSERVAVFDNDGTLWSEQPIYFQLAFAADQVSVLAPNHPEWKDREPFKSILAGDMKSALTGGEHALLELVMASHAGNTTEEFAASVAEWVKEARHPTTGRPYTDLVYQPMLELMEYLRSNGFKTYIVSGGGIEFMRVFAEEVYGIPPEQIIGSSIKTSYTVRAGKPVLERLPEIDFVDDKEGKPVGINRHIGRRPIAAFGNSDGDFQMLEWTTAGPSPRLGVLVHHDDETREWAYDRGSHIGGLDRGLDEAPARGWVVISMKDDWKTIYPDAGPSDAR